MSTNKNNDVRQEQILDDFLQYNLGNAIKALETKTNKEYKEFNPTKILQNIQLIFKNIDKSFSLANCVIELCTADDKMTFCAKIGNDSVSDLAFAEILSASQKISDHLMNKINLIPKGKEPIIIVIDGIVGLFASKEVGNIAKDSIVNIQDILRLSSPSPKLSHSYQEALARAKELESKLIISSHMQNTQSDIQEYYEKQTIISNEEKSYKLKLSNYTKELAYKSNMLSCYLEQLNQAILPQITQNKNLACNETLKILTQNNNKIKILDEKDIDSINTDSPFAYLRALLLCENMIMLDEQENPTLNEKNFSKYLGYNDDSSIIFLLDQQHLTDKYLQARKDLYHSYWLIQQEQAEELASRMRNADFQNANKENTISLKNNKDSAPILETQDKNNMIIFLDDSHSFSNLIHFHNNKLDIFTKDKSYIDIHSLIESYKDSNITLDSLHSPNIQIFFYSHLLLGSQEIQSNPYFFGELDQQGVCKESIPTYHFTPKDKEYNLGTLTIYLNSSTLTLLNYSLLDSSLNIKLELTNKASKEQSELAKQNLEQRQVKEQTKPQSTAFLHPILEDNTILCAHGGRVILKSKLGKAFKDSDIPMVLESDLLNSSIESCPNPITSGGACTQVSLILPQARGLKKHNDDYPIMQDLVSSGVFTDKGVPLVCTPKTNRFKINAPSPTHANNISKEELSKHIDFTPPALSIITYLPDLEEYYLTPSTYEDRESKDSLITSQANFYSPDTPLDIKLKPLNKKQEDVQDLKDNPMLQSLLEELLKDYHSSSFSYRVLTLRIAYSIYEYILIIPKNIPTFVYRFLKQKRSKEELSLGYGRFINLQRDYVRNIDSTNLKSNNNISLNIQGSVLLCPSGMENMRLEVDKCKV